MLQALWEQVRTLLGLGHDIGNVGAGQMALRTIVIYGLTLAIVRLGSKRILAKASAFDVIVAIMLGSIMSRAINGSSPFFPTMLSGMVLLGMHWFFAVLAFHTGWMGSLVKGDRVLLIKDGAIQHHGMRRESITPNDLDAALRLETGQADPSKIERAYLERNGKISVVPYKREPRILDVSVEDGVKTVRIELD